VKKTITVFILIAVLGGLGVTYWRRSDRPLTSFRVARIERGDLAVTISATGTVEPEEVVDVGAQVAGRIETFGKDSEGKTVDYGAVVEQGTVLAQIDSTMYEAEVEQNLAQVEQAKANVSRAEADLKQMQAKLRLAENNWKRAKELGPSRALSATDFDSYQAAYETAQATVVVGEATVLQAQKSVRQSEASLKRAKTNLGYCTIRSPVKGVIIDRRVNIGQTVVASLNAPSLFLIAKDLKRMQVWASVNEADIGNIHPGQKVRFTVDTYPNRTFKGTVGKVRLNASMTQNVVTYVVEIHTDNSDGTLLPYLTANVRFEVANKEKVLTVPNAALRWSPSPQRVSPEFRDKLASDEPKRSSAKSGESKNPGGPKKSTLWIQDGSYVRPIEVFVGITDGTMTEVWGEGLKEEMEVVFGETERTAEETTNNPFTPKFFHGRSR